MIKSNKKEIIYQPIVFRISEGSQNEEFHKLLNRPDLEIIDTIECQLIDFIKIKHPAIKFSQTELEQIIAKHIFPNSLKNYGVWVYYEWSKRLIHILDEDEFFEVRTSRNRNKITKSEQEALRKKKIGVIGLSVGQSVSLTLAMERICGELRLADFDLVELNNINRIRTGLHNIGLPKVYVVAREIAEIDPFISIECFSEGVTEKNIDQFLTKGGNLDLLIEESDGFDMKILSRYKAREHRIPVVMEASDRCMVDVERFDLEPNRKILHGLVEHLDLDLLKELKTTEDKIPFMLDVLGIETASLQLKASMLEIEQTINTWPQLASAVAMGGGITADVSRRILLAQFTQSGRYHIDVEQLIGNKIITPIKIEDEYNFKEITPKDLDFIVKPLKLSLNASTIPNELLKQWIEKSNMAPSAGNNQPWKWYISKSNLFLFHDKAKSFSWSDPFDHLAYLGLGAAIENLKLIALQNGFEILIDYFPNNNFKLLVAQIGFLPTKLKPDLAEQKLINSIEIRCSNRKKGNEELIGRNILDEISIAAGNNAEIIFTQNKDEINKLAEIISTIEKLRFMHPNGHHDFFNKELRWNENEVQKTKDGLDIATLELSNLNLVGLRVASETAVMDKLREWNGGNGLRKISMDVIKTSSAIGLLRISKKIKNIYLEGGRALQKCWLNATANQIAFHPVSSPIFFFDRILLKNDLPTSMVEEILQQKELFSSIFADDPNKKDLFLFRLSYAETVSKRSLRRNVEDTIVIKNQDV